MRPSTPKSAVRRLAIVLMALWAGACVTASGRHGSGPARGLAATAPDLSAASFARIKADMDPSILDLATRLGGLGPADVWGRPIGWEHLDLEEPPSLFTFVSDPQQAQRINAYLPNSDEVQPGAAPFFLRAVGAERERAVFCLTQAIYYEAALEPLSGQEAVAQVVLNRMRHPAYPKSVCGVVFQGSARVTGCQFSFTCDGSRDRAPAPAIWAQTRLVAERALGGYVMRSVGGSTFYHADYVFPRWAPTLVKITQVGAHIFYRFPGPTGRVSGLTGRYAGGELRVSLAGPSPEAILAARAAAEAGQAGIDTIMIPDPTAPGGMRTRVAGQIVFGRRVPTPEEIARINANLAAVEAALPKVPDAEVSPPAPPLIAAPPAKAP